MAKSHDIAAQRIARIHGCKYRRSKSPDAKCPGIRVEVKSKASEIPEALRQLGGGSGDAYIGLPKPAHPKALKRLRGRKTGLMDYQGKIIKPSTRE